MMALSRREILCKLFMPTLKDAHAPLFGVSLNLSLAWKGKDFDGQVYSFSFSFG